MAWIRKYAPKNLKEFVDQKKAVEQFLVWYKNYKPGSKAALLYGPPGVGKTALVRAFARENNLNLIEMNASDVRSAQKIKEVFRASAKQASLFGKKKMFLIDEVDGISGKEDRGGLAEIIKFIKESVFPVVLTANDAWDPKLKPLRSYCEMIQFSPIPPTYIVKRLKEIAEVEGLIVDINVLKALAERSKGDLRAAINDLETLATKKEITVKDLEDLGYREREEDVFQTLKMIFKTKSIKAARFAVSLVDKDPEELIWWIEENVSNEYETIEEIVKAYEFLSWADLFRKRIVSRQNWRLMVYMIDLMSAGVSSAKKDVYRKFTKFKPPLRLQTYAKLKPLKENVNKALEKLSEELHCSTSCVKKEFIPLLKILAQNEKYKREIMKYLELDKNSLEQLLTL